jgi:hypothetical protein
LLASGKKAYVVDDSVLQRFGKKMSGLSSHFDISRFLEVDDDQLDAAFVQIFNPDIEPTGFSPTTRAFLEEIVVNLSKPIEP